MRLAACLGAFCKVLQNEKYEKRSKVRSGQAKWIPYSLLVASGLVGLNRFDPCPAKGRPNPLGVFGETPPASVLDDSDMR